MNPKKRAHDDAPLHVYLILSFMAGCAAPKTAVPLMSGDLSNVRKISVGAFEGPGGGEVMNAFVKNLVHTNLQVTDAHHAGQVILKGSVTDFKPSNQYIVFLGPTTLMTARGQSVNVTDPIVSPGSYQATLEGKPVGITNPQVVSVTALFGVMVQLTDPVSGRALWANSTAYEGLDLESAR